MILIRRKSDNVVLYAIQDNEPYMLKNFLSFKGARALDVNDTTHEAITASELPQHYSGGVFTYTNGVWTCISQEYLDDLLVQLKADKKQAMKQARKSATESTTTVTINAVDYEIDCDAPARSAIHQTIDNSTLAGLTDTDIVNWKLATGNYAQFTIADLKSIAVQMAMHIQAQYEKEAVLIARIDAATIDTLDTLTWV